MAMRSDKFYGGSWEWGCSASFFLSFLFSSSGKKKTNKKPPPFSLADWTSMKETPPPLPFKRALTNCWKNISLSVQNSGFLGQGFLAAIFNVRNTHLPQISQELGVEGRRLSIQNHPAGDGRVDLGVEKSLKLTTRHYILLTKEHSNPTCLL